MKQPPSPTREIAARVRKLREGRGWSAAHLAAEMTKVGVPWGRIVVSKLENGGRESVSVDELLALAYVFSVAPVNLMVPIDDDSQPYEVVPGVTATRDVARAWICGLDEPFGDPRIYASEMPAHMREPDRQGRIPHVVAAAAFTEALEDARRKAGYDDGR